MLLYRNQRIDIDGLSINQVIEELARVKGALPEGHVGDALELCAEEDYYGSLSPYLQLTYRSPETNEEKEAREKREADKKAKEARRKAKKQQADLEKRRELYERLKREFESTQP